MDNPFKAGDKVYVYRLPTKEEVDDFQRGSTQKWPGGGEEQKDWFLENKIELTVSEDIHVKGFVYCDYRRHVDDKHSGAWTIPIGCLKKAIKTTVILTD
jgi:hypothetical protein